MDILQWLQEWFRAQCNGSWEHTYAIRIDTLDNPGWGVRIGIYETELEGKAFETIESLDDADDWMVCEVKHGKVLGGGGTSKLEMILQVFKDWAER